MEVEEEIVNELVVIARDLSEDETQQQTNEYLRQLQGMTSNTFALGKQTARSFRRTADTLDDLWKNCKKVHIAGASAGIVGGILTIGGGIATIMSAGAATPLLLFGIGFGFAGAGTNIVASFIEASMNSNEIKKAEDDWKNAMNHIRNMETNLQVWLSFGVDLLHLLRRLTPRGVALVCARMAELQAAGMEATAQAVAQATAKAGAEATAKAVAEATAKAGAEATAKAGAEATAKAGAEATARAVAEATAKAGAEATAKAGAEATAKAGAEATAKAGARATAKAGAQMADDVAGAAAKAGAQAADDVAKAGANAGTKLIGKVIIGVSVAFLVWDAIDLGLSINDLVKEKGSDAAKVLRAKADELDKICSVS